jgi:hypothetical protein
MGSEVAATLPAHGPSHGASAMLTRRGPGV